MKTRKKANNSLLTVNIRRKTVSVICIFSIMFALISFSVTASAATLVKGNNGKIEWNISSSGVLKISRYVSSGTVEISDFSTAGFPIWYQYKDVITSIVVDKNITRIGDFAFYGLINAKTVSIEKDVTSIGTAVFEHCNALTSFTVSPDNTSLTTTSGILYSKDKNTLIAYPANKLAISFEIPATVTTIKGYAFSFNQRLVTITQNTGSVKIINGHAFSNCASLKNITIKNNCTTIENKAFYNSSKLNKVTIPPSVTSIADILFQPPETLADLEVQCAKNSPIYNYAKNKGYRVNVKDWTFTCDFDADGGECGTKSKVVTYDSTYGTLPSVTKTGYEFVGWYLNDKQITSTTKVTTASSHSLKAKYKANNYTVAFDPNGGKCNTKFITVTYNSAYGLLPEATKEGYVFDGWYLGDKKVTASTKVVDAAPHTLKARFIGNSCTLLLNSNGGYCDTQNITITYGKEYGYLPIPVKMGYTFIGWFTENGKQIFTNTIFEDESINTLYAHYKKIVSKTTGLSIKYLSKTSVKLSWNKQDNVAGYEIYKKAQSEKYSLYKRVSGTSAKINLSSKKSYNFKVRAYVYDDNKLRCGAYSSVVSRPKTFLSKPKIKNTYSKSTGLLKVNWKAVNNAKKYEIYRFKNHKWIKAKTTSSLSFFLYAYKGNTYRFKVRAVNTVMGHKIYSKFTKIVKKI